MIIPSNRTVFAGFASALITATPAASATPATDSSLDMGEILTLLFGIVASFTAFIAIAPIITKWRAARAKRPAKSREGPAASVVEMQPTPEPSSDEHYEAPAPPAPYHPPSIGRPAVPADGSTAPRSVFRFVSSTTHTD